MIPIVGHRQVERRTFPMAVRRSSSFQCTWKATSKDRGEASNAPASWVSLEEKRLKAVENWRRTYHDNRGKEQGAQPEPADAKERSDNEKTHPEKDSGLEFDPDR